MVMDTIGDCGGGAAQAQALERRREADGLRSDTICGCFGQPGCPARRTDARELRCKVNVTGTGSER